MPDDVDEAAARRRDRRAAAARAASRAGGTLSLVAVLLGAPDAGSVAPASLADWLADDQAEIVVVGSAGHDGGP